MLYSQMARRSELRPDLSARRGAVIIGELARSSYPRPQRSRACPYSVSAVVGETLSVRSGDAVRSTAAPEFR